MAFNKNSPVLVLGGGFAGLACAVELARVGRRVTVLEKKSHLGGRAFSFKHPQIGEVDNGQHLFMACYDATRKFLRRIGAENRLDIYPDVRVDYAEKGGTRRVLNCPAWLPAPVHLAAGLLGLGGVTMREKLSLLAVDQALKSMAKGPVPGGVERLTVRQWLDALGVSRNFQTRFFDPAAIGILNESPDIASAAGFVQALRVMFFSGAAASHFALAKTGLSELYVDDARRYIEEHGGQIATGVKLNAVLAENGQIRGVKAEDGTLYESDAVVSTLPARDLKALELPAELRGPWENLEWAPIVGATLKMDRPVMSERFVGLLGTNTHWIFNKSRIMNSREDGQTISAVISAAHEAVAWSPEKILETMSADAAACLPGFSDAKILASKVVKEPFATLSPVPGAEMTRPEPGAGMPGFYFAGDWTRTGLPATIESACLSGQIAAEKILRVLLPVIVVFSLNAGRLHAAIRGRESPVAATSWRGILANLRGPIRGLFGGLTSQDANFLNVALDKTGVIPGRHNLAEALSSASSRLQEQLNVDSKAALPLPADVETMIDALTRMRTDRKYSDPELAAIDASLSSLLLRRNRYLFVRETQALIGAMLRAPR